MSGSSSSTTPPPLAVELTFQIVWPSSSSLAVLMPPASSSKDCGSSTDSNRSGEWGGTSTISSMNLQVPEPGPGQAERAGSSGGGGAHGRLARLAQALERLGDRAARAADPERVDEHDRGEHDPDHGEDAGHAEVELRDPAR